MRTRKYPAVVLFILLATLPAVPARAEDAAKGEPPPRGYLRLLGEDVLHEITAPARWNRREWGGFSLAVLGVGVAATLDRSISNSVQRTRSSFQDNLARTVAPLGAQDSFVLLGGFYALGSLRGDDEERQVAEDGLAASLVAGGLVAPAVKYIAGRARPRQNQGASNFDFFESHNQSFPSGHATQAFAVASVIATHYPSPWVEALSYGAATLVGYARIRQRAHFLSDVTAGALIGTAVGRSVTHFNDDRRAGKPTRIVVMPTVGPDGRAPGVAMAMSF